MTSHKKAIVISWAENTGLRHTGKLVQRDANWFEELEPCPKACALVYSRDLSELDRAHDYVQEMVRANDGKYNIKVAVMPDTDDILQIARNAVQFRPEKQTCDICGKPATHILTGYRNPYGGLSGVPICQKCWQESAPSEPGKPIAPAGYVWGNDGKLIPTRRCE